MTEATQEKISKSASTLKKDKLKSDIDKINDEVTIEKVRIFIMGILTQQGLDRDRPR